MIVRLKFLAALVSLALNAVGVTLRAKLIDSPKMRSASCGAWKPDEFSASTKSR